MAMFAMLLQIVLCLGHIHLHDLGSHPAGRDAVAPMAVSLADQPLERPQPGDLPEEDNCPLCMIMHMVASGAMPMAPVLAQPTDFGSVTGFPVIRLDLSSPRYASFQTRAPPGT